MSLILGLIVAVAIILVGIQAIKWVSKITNIIFLIVKKYFLFLLFIYKWAFLIFFFYITIPVYLIWRWRISKSSYNLMYTKITEHLENHPVVTAQNIESMIESTINYNDSNKAKVNKRKYCKKAVSKVLKSLEKKSEILLIDDLGVSVQKTLDYVNTKIDIIGLLCLKDFSRDFYPIQDKTISEILNTLHPEIYSHEDIIRTEDYFINERVLQDFLKNLNYGEFFQEAILQGLLGTSADIKEIIFEFAPDIYENFIDLHDKEFNKIFIVSENAEKYICEYCNSFCPDAIFENNAYFCSPECLYAEQNELFELQLLKTKANYDRTECTTKYDNKLEATLVSMTTLQGMHEILERQSLFSTHQGHGFAAEEANHLSDYFEGKDAIIAGRDNFKNGPDRIVDNILIQTKYFKTGRESVAACFDKKTGDFRYYNADGTPMKIEVPSNHYDDAVRIMTKKIKSNQFDNRGVPADKIIKKGSCTYEQAKNIAKAPLTADSLIYDAQNGLIVARNSAGIGFIVNFLQNAWQGRFAMFCMQSRNNTWRKCLDIFSSRRPSK